MTDEEVEKWIDEQYDILDQLEYKKQEIGLIMHGQSDYYYQYPDEYEKDRRIVELENEVERLEHRLANCIEPKFKVGQKVYHLLSYDGVKEDFIESNHHICSLKISRFGIYEDYLFATEEEAKAKLEKMKNG